MSGNKPASEAHVTLPLTAADMDRINIAAQHAGLTPEVWMARVLRRESRRAQIAAYEGPDPDTQAWMAVAAQDTAAMFEETASADER